MNLAHEFGHTFYIQPAFADASPKDSLGDLQALICDTQSLGEESLLLLFLPKFTAMRYCS